MKAWINMLDSYFVKRWYCMKLLFKSKVYIAYILPIPLLWEARAGTVPQAWHFSGMVPGAPGELWNANKWGLVSEVQSVLLSRLISLLGSSCGMAPPSFWVTAQVPHAAEECPVHDCSLLLPTPSPHRQKRLWQTSSWPLGAPRPRPRREPQPPKPSTCRPRRAAPARWGMSCLAQYVQCCFTGCPVCVQLPRVAVSQKCPRLGGKSPLYC